jgi:hypothetical protein
MNLFYPRYLVNINVHYVNDISTQMDKAALIDTVLTTTDSSTCITVPIYVEECSKCTTLQSRVEHTINESGHLRFTRDKGVDP